MAGEEGVDAVAVALKGEGGGAGDGPALAPEERLAELDGVGLADGDLGQALLKAGEGGWPVSVWTVWW